MTFGEYVRSLRQAKGLSLRKLASQVGVGFTYLSRVETGTMTYGDYPSESLIHRLCDALDGDEDKLLLLAEKIPPAIRRRVMERPEVFGRLARLSDDDLDQIIRNIDSKPKISQRRR
jgi:transcriptional regulator with XRE-family HTH domain